MTQITMTTKRPIFARRFLIPALILALLFAGFAVVRRGSGAKEGAETTYEFGETERGDVRSFVTATGVIQPWKIVDVKSNVAGRIERLAVDAGDKVNAGDLIMVIDPTDTQVAVDQARADLEAAGARKTQAEVNVTQQQVQTRARVTAAERAVQAARARLAQARASMVVQPKLTTSSIRQAEASLSSARKAVAQAQAARRQLQDQLSQLRDVTIPLNRETVEANVEQARANLETAQSEHNRQKELLGLGYVAKSDVEAAYSRLATAQAAVRTAEQRRATLQRENQIAIQEMTSRLAEAQSRIEGSQAQVRQAEAALGSSRDNRFQDDVSRQDYIAAQAAVKQAEAELASARAELHQITVRRKEVQAAEAALVRGRAALMQASTNLGYTKIMAPRSGVVLVKNVEEGTVVPSSRGSIGSTNALLQIGDVSRLWVVTLVDETDIGQVRVGQKVDVKVDAYPDKPIPGKVIRIDPQAKIEQNVTMIPVTVEITKPDERFKPGMSAECEFIIAEVKDVVTVPNEALRENEGVFTVQKLVEGKPRDFKVTVGVAGQEVTEIKSGLKPGEQVVTRTIEPEASEVNNPFSGNRGPRRGGAKAGAKGGAKGGGGRGG